MSIHDVIIIGGSYAGISAGLQLARARKRVLVVDAGQRRNRFASHAHGFLGQDGAEPGAIVAQARAQLLAYPTVEWEEAEAVSASGALGRFEIGLADEATRGASRLLLAGGVKDDLPDVPGLAERWGRHVFHCPYCHGYELGGERVAVLATGPLSQHQALLLREWGPVTFLLNDAFAPAEADLATLEARDIQVEPARVRGITGAAEVQFADERTLAFAGVFTASRISPATPIAALLGCAMTETPMGVHVSVTDMKQTSVPGVFACGDIARPAGNVAMAVGDGAFAGAAVHRSLAFPEAA